MLDNAAVWLALPESSGTRINPVFSLSEHHFACSTVLEIVVPRGSYKMSVVLPSHLFSALIVHERDLGAESNNKCCDEAQRCAQSSESEERERGESERHGEVYAPEEDEEQAV
jgi:hypothetical protein